MLLVVRHGTTKHVVRSFAHHRTYLQPFHRHFATACCRLTVETSQHAGTPPAPEGSPKSYAVLGGGVTGLSAAYFLRSKFPQAKITIYEASKKLGGWVDSETVEVNGGKVLFEWGPRSLRPDLSGPGKITAQLIHELGLGNRIVATHRDHVAARNRFVYYPDHLVRMPGPYPNSGLVTNVFRNLPAFFTEPIFKGMIGGMLAEPTVDTREKHMEDESVGNFVTRRFGPTIADNMLSALFHGIYAGDIYKLSARTLLAKLWYMETRDPAGSGILPEVFELVLKQEQIWSSSDAALLAQTGYLKETDEVSGMLYRALSQQSVYTFIDGIGQLTTRLEETLSKSTQIRIATENAISHIEKDPHSGKISISSSGDAKDESYDYVISTLSPTAISDTSNGNPFLGPPEIRDAATVMVVNLYYSNPNLTDPYRGFGYLIPQSIPMEQNPERALGVIFASEISGSRSLEESPSADSQDSELTSSTLTFSKLTSQPPSTDPSTHWPINHQDTAPGTKLTVMLGGHWWSSWSSSDIPSPSPAIEMAKSVLARHMQIYDEPLLAKARLQKDAIPQYRVGYRSNMVSVHGDLEAYRGRIRVAGPAWQGGVGVNDCVRRAWEVVEDLGGEEDMVDGKWKTGLEHYTKAEQWFKVSRKDGGIVIQDDTTAEE